MRFKVKTTLNVSEFYYIFHNNGPNYNPNLQERRLFKLSNLYV